MNEIEINMKSLIWDQAQKNQLVFERHLDRIKLAQLQIERLTSDQNELRQKHSDGETDWIFLGNRLIAPYLINEVHVHAPETEEDIADSKSLWEIVVGEEVFTVALDESEAQVFLDAIGGQGELDLTDYFEADPDTAEEDKSNFHLPKLNISQRVNVAEPGQSASDTGKPEYDDVNIHLNGVRLLDVLARIGITSVYSRKSRMGIIARYFNSRAASSHNVDDFVWFVERNYAIPRMRSTMRNRA